MPIAGVRAIDHTQTGETDEFDEPVSRRYPHLSNTLSTVEAGDSVSARDTIRDDRLLTQPAPCLGGGRHWARLLHLEWTTARARALVVG